MNNPGSSSSKRVQDRTERLNKNCFCVTLDLPSLREALEQEAGEPAFFETFIGPKTHLFSHVPVFLSATTVNEMRAIAVAVETTAQLEAYKTAVLSWAPEIAWGDHGPLGALMGYDFHLGEDGPRLIEINTNAGGAFLNAFLARAQRACCAEMDIPRRCHRSRTRRFACSRTNGFGSGERARRNASPSSMTIRRNSTFIPSSCSRGKFWRHEGVDAVIADADHLSRSYS